MSAIVESSNPSTRFRARFVSIPLVLVCVGLSCGEWALPRAHAEELAKVESLRPEVARPVQVAQELAKQKKFKEVQMAAAADEIIVASGHASQAEMISLQGLAETYYRNKEYAKAINALTRYFKMGGSEPQMRVILSQSYYLSKDFAGAVTALHTEVEEHEKLGKPPPEDSLQLLADSYAQLNNNTGSLWALERLISYYPKKEYWSDALARIRHNPGVGDRLLLDVLRLKSATGTLTSASDHMEMAQLALKAGLPAEAKKIIEQGFTSRALGTGADADRHKQMRDLALKQAAEEQKKLPQYEAQALASRDKAALLQVGFAYVTYGEYAKGLSLMEAGLHIGGLEKQGDAKLHLGIAYFLAGQKSKAADTFKTVRGIHGSADLAKLWTLHLRRAP